MSDYKVDTVILNQTSPANISQNSNVVNVALPNVFYSTEHEVALASLFVYFSWNNVTTKFNNNSFNYIWTDGATYPVAIPNGYYSVDDITGYLQFVMTTNGHYLVDSTGAKVFYLKFVTNSVYYSVTFESTPIPSALPAGWSNPNSVNLNGNRPQVVILSTNNFGSLIGFNPQTMPTTQASTPWSQNSDYVPQISPITSVSIVTNVASTGAYNQVSGIIGAFSVGDTAFGGQIVIQPYFPIFFPVPDKARFDTISIALFDQNNFPIDLLDQTMTATLYLRCPKSLTRL
jgi:hypothetical protein